MYTTHVMINTFSKARRFCSLISHMNGEFDLVSDRYVVNAKSMLGIFSLDLSQPLQLNIYSKENIDDILKALTPFLISDSTQ